MTESKPRLRTFLSERNIAVVLSALALLGWAFNQLSFLGMLVIVVAVFVLLLQLEIKHRVKELERRRDVAKKKRLGRRQGIRSLRATALNSLPSPILLIDETKTISFANDSAKALLGENILHDDVYVYLRQSNFVTVLERTLSGSKFDGAAIRYTTNQDRSFDITIVPVKGKKLDGKNRIQAMVYFYEVTSLLRTEQMRVDFVANASHELRTPLTTILGFLETLQESASDDHEAQQRFLGIMQKEAERMKRLINDLLSLSRIEMLRHEEPNSSIDLESTLSIAIEACKPDADERNINLVTALEDASTKIVADQDQLVQVFLNLVGNAVKYADSGTSVTVASHKDPASSDQIFVSITDEGPGIAPEHLTRLTERFYRVDTARSRKMGGTGLGLAIVKHILLRHGSQLDIKSKVGAGTSFSFRLTAGKK